MSPRRRPARKRASPPSPSRAAWMTARARNALRRPVFIGAVSIVTFVASLVALIVVPQQAKRAANAIRPAAAARPDTHSHHELAARWPSDRSPPPTRRSPRRGRSSRSSSPRPPQLSATDTTSTGEAITPPARSRRDTLTAEIDELDRLLTRADNAPLLGSYRALAEAAPMQGRRAGEAAARLARGDRARARELQRRGRRGSGLRGAHGARQRARTQHPGARRRGGAAPCSASSPRCRLRPSAAASALAARPLPDTHVGDVPPRHRTHRGGGGGQPARARAGRAPAAGRARGARAGAGERRCLARRDARRRAGVRRDARLRRRLLRRSATAARGRRVRDRARHRRAGAGSDQAAAAVTGARPARRRSERAAVPRSGRRRPSAHLSRPSPRPAPTS